MSKTRRQILASELYQLDKKAKRRWHQLYPEKHKLSMRKANLRRKFGITLEQYEEILQSQQGGCAICGGVEFRNLAVDHDHITGKIRGLLCGVCNKGLGIHERNKQKFEAYLERFRG